MILGHPDFSVQPTGASPANDSLFFHFQHGSILMNVQNEEPVLPEWTHVQPLVEPGFVPFEIAHTKERGIFSPFPNTSLSIRETEILKYIDFNVFRSLSTDTAGLMTGCRHLWSWY